MGNASSNTTSNRNNNLLSDFESEVDVNIREIKGKDNGSKPVPKQFPNISPKASKPDISPTVPQMSKADSESSAVNVISKKNTTAPVASSSSPLDLSSLAKSLLGSPSAPSATPNLKGGFDDAESEFEINIIPQSFNGGGFVPMSESDIVVETIPVAESVPVNMQGGSADSEFNNDKLLQNILQMGGNDSDSESMSSNSSINSSSYQQKERKQTKTVKKVDYSDSFADSDDESSSSSEDSNRFSTESSLEFNSESVPVDFADIQSINAKNARKNLKSKYYNNDNSINYSEMSEVYVLTDSSDRVGGVTLRSFADPLNSKKSKKNKSRK